MKQGLFLRKHTGNLVDPPVLSDDTNRIVMADNDRPCEVFPIFTVSYVYSFYRSKVFFTIFRHHLKGRIS